MRSHPAVLAAAVLAAACAGEEPPQPTPGEPGAPAIVSVAPPVAAEGATFRLTVVGANFGGTGAEGAPAISVTRVRSVAGAAAGDAPVPLAIASLEERDGVATVQIDVPGALAAGVYALSVAAEGGARTFEDAFAVVPAPQATTVAVLPAVAGAPGSLACAANALTLAVEGARFLRAGGSPPTVALDPVPPAPAGAARRILAAQAAGCVAIPFSRADLALCARLDAPLPTETPAGAWSVTVSEPVLAASSPPLPLVVDALPSLALPTGALSVAAAELSLDVVSGAGGIIVGPAGGPSVKLAEGPALASSTADCAPLAVAGYARCERLRVTIPKDTASGVRTIQVSTPSGCAREGSLFLAPPPVVDPPEPWCPGSPGVRLTGSGFLSPAVYLAGEVPTALVLETGCPSPYAACGEIVLRPPPLAPGTYEAFLVSASIPPVQSAPFAITVGTGPPLVDDASLRLVRQGFSGDVHVGVFEVTGSVEDVLLVPSDPAGAPRPVSFVEDADGVTIAFPADAPENRYAVEVRDASSCPGLGHPLGGIRVVSDPVVARYDFELDLLDEVGSWWGVPELEPADAPPAVARLLDGARGSFVAKAAGDGRAPWYFAFLGWGDPAAVARLRFALRATGEGVPLDVPGVVLVNGVATLERSLARPAAGAWTGFDVPLDDASGWTYRDPTASRPATLADLAGPWPEIRVLGAWTDGPTEASIDDLLIELGP
jgi:hypothetical protein